MRFKPFLESYIRKSVSEHTQNMVNTMFKVSQKNNMDAVVVSTGRDVPGDEDPTSLTVQFANGETKKVYSGSRTLRSGDHIVVVGNRAF